MWSSQTSIGALVGENNEKWWQRRKRSFFLAPRSTKNLLTPQTLSPPVHSSHGRCYFSLYDRCPPAAIMAHNNMPAVETAGKHPSFRHDLAFSLQRDSFMSQSWNCLMAWTRKSGPKQKKQQQKIGRCHHAARQLLFVALVLTRVAVGLEFIPERCGMPSTGRQPIKSAVGAHKWTWYKT